MSGGYPLWMDVHEKHDHCGCCGECFRWLDGSFCLRCRTPVGHLGPSDLPPWDRTYLAVHGESCPFEVVLTGETTE